MRSINTDHFLRSYYSLLRAINFFFVFLCSNLVFAQMDNLYENFNSLDGFPSNETYDLFEDYRGFLWIASDNGVIRFDVKNHKIFNINNGMTDNVVFQFLPFNDWIICATSNSKICLINVETQRCFPYPYNHVIQDYIYTERAIINDIDISSDSTLYISFKRIGGIQISKYGNLIVNKIKNVQTVYLEKGLVHTVVGAEEVKEILIIEGRDTICLKGDDNQLLPGIASSKHGITIIPLKKGFFTVKNGKSDFHLTSEVIYTRIEDSLLLIGTWSGLLVYEFDENGEIILRNRYLDDHIISSAIIDRHGALWASTLENGIYRINTNRFRTIDFNFDGYLENIHVSESCLFLLTYQPNFRVLCFDRKTFQKLDEFQFHGRGGRFIRSKFEGMTSYFSHSGVNYHFFDSPPYIRPANFILMKGITCDGPNESIIVSNNDSIKIVSQNNQLYSSKRLNGNCEDLGKMDDSYYAVLTKGGANTICLFDVDDKFEIEGLYEYKSNSRVVSIIPFKKSLLIFEKNGTISEMTSHATRKIKSPFNSINEAILTSENNFVVATPNGLYIKTGNDQVRFEKVLSGETNGVASFKSHIYALRKREILEVLIDTTQLLNQFPIEIIEISCNGKNYLNSSHIELLGGGQNIEVKFVEPGIFPLYNEYKCRLIENNSRITWYNFAGNSINFHNLEPGSYKLSIYDKLGQHQSKEINIIIEPNLHEKKEFYIAVVSISLLLIISIIYSLFRRIRQKKQYEQNLIKYQSEATLAQLNPHFIFNMLNSVQSLIYIGRNQKASKLIKQFSNLLRTILKDSSKNFKDFRLELDSILEYTELENSRFNRRVEVIVNNSLPEGTEIITFIIQPIIENAFKHAFNNNFDHPKIYLSAENMPLNDQIKIAITDNGKGIDNLKPRTNNSGLELVKLRLALFNKKNRIQILNNLNLTNSIFPTGTTIIIYLNQPNED